MGMPQDIIDKLNAAAVEALGRDDSAHCRERAGRGRRA